MRGIATEILTPKTIGGLRVVPVQERSSYLNILVYGDSGVGKTRLAGSADMVPSMRPVLFIDFEGGTETLKHCGYDKVETVRIKSWKELQGVYDQLHAGDHDFRTVVLDSLTEIQKFNMYNIMGELMQKRPDLDPDVPGMREWGKNLEQLRRMVRGFRDLEMHTIFTALAKEEKDQKSGLRLVYPMLSGQLAAQVAAFMDIVLYYYVKQVGNGDDSQFLRLLLSRKTETHVAKDRSGQLPAIVEMPTMQTLFDLMYPNPNKAVKSGIQEGVS